MRFLLMIILYLMLVSCSAELNDLKHFTQQVKQTTPPYIEPYLEPQVYLPFNYTSRHLRSPFIPLTEKTSAINDPQVEHCYQLNAQRPKAPLETYDLNTLSFGGSITVNDMHWALVKSADGILHKVKMGDYIGLFDGKVTQIHHDVIYVEQFLPDGAGCWKIKATEIKTETATVFKVGE